MRIVNIQRIVIASSVVLLAGFGLGGCYESTSSDTPQAQTPPPAKSGPLTDAAVGNQNNSALGGAKRASENIANQAEQASQKVADEADK